MIGCENYAIDWFYHQSADNARKISKLTTLRWYMALNESEITAASFDYRPIFTSLTAAQ